MKTDSALLFLSAALLISAQAASPCWAAAPSGANLPPAKALQELKDGNQRFVSGKASACSDPTELRTKLASGQAPNAIILSCSDSRVPPEQVFDQRLGQLFVVRVAGNVLDPDAIASMEYAVANLGSRLIVVLGHESCGAVKSALTVPAGKDAGSPSLNHLLTQIRANLGKTASSGDSKLREPVMKNVSAVAREILKRSKLIRDAVAKGQVEIEDGIYDLGSGQVDFWSSENTRPASQP